jgi:hypothetical protein
MSQGFCPVFFGSGSLRSAEGFVLVGKNVL